MSVTEYYTRFKRLWDQLHNYAPLPECSCGAMKILSTSHDKAYAMRFLMGLNESFETIRSQILMYEPLPSISKVYALVLQEESHKCNGHGNSFSSQPDSVAMYANSKSNSGNSNWKGNKKERPLCTHCNMLGHTMDKCYKLHGYPPGHKHKGKSNANANQVSSSQYTVAENSSVASTQCPISKEQCEKLLAFLNTGSGSCETHHAATVAATAGMASTSSQPQSTFTNTNLSNTMSGILPNLSFTPTLEHSIFSAKIFDRKEFSASDWTIDTGATDHMIHSISYFTTITATLHTHVNLPKGEIALVTHIGTVKISEKLVLHDVLCIPSFNFNLISISQLAKTTFYCLIFFGNL